MFLLRRSCTELNYEQTSSHLILGGIWHVSSPISIKPNIFLWHHHIKLRCKMTARFSFFVATGITARGKKPKQLLRLKVQEWHLVVSRETCGIILCETILKQSIRVFLCCFYAWDPTPNFESLPPTLLKNTASWMLILQVCFAVAGFSDHNFILVSVKLIQA